MATIWVCEGCQNDAEANGYKKTGYMADAGKCDGCLSCEPGIRREFERSDDPPGPGAWACRGCARNYVEKLKTYRGDPAQKRADAGNCEFCGLPAILFWIEPIAAPVAVSKPRCDGCRFFVVSSTNEKGSILGTCRRNPPQIGEDDGAIWPYLFGNREDAWCGEFQPKPVNGE